MRNYKIWKVLAIIVFASLGIMLIGYIVMTLWNNILTPVLNVNTIDIKQAIGIFVLARILTGGFTKGWGGRGGYWKEKMNRKLASMPDDERKYYQKLYWKKCGFGSQNYKEDKEEEKIVNEAEVNHFN